MSKLLMMIALTFAFHANAEVKKIDPASSTVAWKGTKKIGKVHVGTISIKEGTVETDAKNNLKGGNFVIDMTTISDQDMATDTEHQKKLEGHLSSPDFFDVQTYPTSTFKITSVTKKSKNVVNVTGDLTIRGKTNSISFPAKVTADASGLTGEAKFKIDRTKWDIKYGAKNFFKELTADKIINNDIEFTIKLVAKN